MLNDEILYKELFNDFVVFNKELDNFWKVIDEKDYVFIVCIVYIYIIVFWYIGVYVLVELVVMIELMVKCNEYGSVVGFSD